MDDRDISRGCLATGQGNGWRRPIRLMSPGRCKLEHCVQGRGIEDQKSMETRGKAVKGGS